MKKLLRSLASLKLAVVLLVLLLVGLAAGTILESGSGAEVAGRLVYYSPWFIGLEVAFAVNVLASIVTHYPFGAARIGFATTHLSLALILAGACTSWLFKVEGHLELAEGQSGNAIVDQDRDGRVVARATLPFSVKLDRFRIDRYPGTMMPSGFRSDVQVLDGATAFPASIWMNHELTWRGWSFFQSSYRMEPGHTATILSVSRDPGERIVFAGYALLLVGMTIVIATRAGQARKRAEAAALAGTRNGNAAKAAATAALALLLLPGAAGAADKDELLRRLPIQHDGRVMPLDTLARESLWKVTGHRSWQGFDPVEVAVWWTMDPQAAANAAMVEVGSRELAAQVGLPEGPASYDQLVDNPKLMQLLQEADTAKEMDRPRRGVLAAAEKLEERLSVLQGFLKNEAIRPIPAADANAKWGVSPARSADELAALAGGPRLAGWLEPGAIERELTYHAVRPTRVAWLVLLAALALSILAWSGRRKALDAAAFAGLLAGFAVMTWGIATRWLIAGRIPAANMYESLLFLAWGVGLFALVAFAVLRNRLVVLNANAMAALTMALTDLLPIDGFIHPVPPVLAGTPWLAIHVPIIMVSYSVLALGVVIAHMQVGFTIFAPQRVEQIKRMHELLYWYVLVGATLLIAGILTGSVWAASSWGRYWGWDPKEVWSLVAFLAYMAILHARVEKLLGPFGVAAISIVAFQTILMTYLGVNFVLATGLHSYGMGDSPVVMWMVIVALAEAAFLGLGWSAHRRAAPAVE